MGILRGDVDLGVNQIRLHDHAVRNWVASIENHTSGDLDLNVIFATPDRAFATLEQLLKKRLGDRATKTKVMPYPYASVARIGYRYAPDRQRPIGRFLTGVYTSDKRTTYGVKWPNPYDFEYQIDFWARNVDTIDLFNQWTLSESAPEGTISLDFSPVWVGWGHKLLYFTLGGSTDNSVLEGDEQARVARLTVSITLKGWILLPPMALRTVHKIVADSFNAINVTAAEIDAAPSLYPSLGKVEVDEHGRT